MTRAVPTHPRWMYWVLIAAAVYNLAWGGLVMFFPLTPFRWAGLEPPNCVPIWQCLGMVVGVYGIGYAIAARDPLRHWPIVLVGLLGKVLGPIGFVWYAAHGELPWRFGLTILGNDLVWWLPFGLILYHALDRALQEDAPVLPVSEALAQVRTAAGPTLAELSRPAPLLVVFFRHFG